MMDETSAENCIIKCLIVTVEIKGSYSLSEINKYLFSCERAGDILLAGSANPSSKNGVKSLISGF